MHVTNTVRLSNILAILIAIALSLADASAQTGIKTSLWKWTQPASHHNSVVKVETKSGSGSGVLVHIFNTRPIANGYEGLCLTAEHVVGDNVDGKIKVTYRNGKRARNCKVISTNEALDVAVLWVWVPNGIAPAPIANADVTVGQKLEFCGLGGDSSLNLMRHFTSFAESPTSEKQIFASAPLLPGDSGGPVFNNAGQLVGIISGGWFWFDGGVKSPNGKSISVTWPARACHLAGLSDLLVEAIADKLDLAKR